MHRQDPKQTICVHKMHKHPTFQIFPLKLVYYSHWINVEDKVLCNL